MLQCGKIQTHRSPEPSNILDVLDKNFPEPEIAEIHVLGRVRVRGEEARAHRFWRDGPGLARQAQARGGLRVFAGGGAGYQQGAGRVGLELARMHSKRGEQENGLGIGIQRGGDERGMGHALMHRGQRASARAEQQRGGFGQCLLICCHNPVTP